MLLIGFERVANCLLGWCGFCQFVPGAPFGIDGISGGVHRHLFPPDEPMPVIALEDIAEFAFLAFGDPGR